MNMNWIAAALEETFNLPVRHFSGQPQANPLSLARKKLAHQDLRQYASEAILPKMDVSPSVPPIPPSGHRGHLNRLAVESKTDRNLDTLYAMDNFEKIAEEFSMLNLPAVQKGDSDVDPDNGGGIVVPALGFQISSVVPIGKPSDVDRVLRWVMEYPLATVNHMMHLVYPQTTDYTIQRGSDEGDDRGVFRWATWGRDESTITEAQDTWSESVLVFVQPPWILTPRDFEAFVNLRAFPPFNGSKPLKSIERLWAKIWDICSQKRSHWFVLTTYWGWVFGAFSQGRSRAFTSEIIPFNLKLPTVVQCLFSWFACAIAGQIHPHGAWAIPEVPEPVEALDDISVPSHHDSIDIDVSESSWNAASSDDEEDTQTVIMELPSHELRHEEPTSSRQRRLNTKISSWKHEIHHGELPNGPFEGPRPPPSEAGSATTVSVSTVHDLANSNQRDGTYMSAPVEETRLEYSYAGSIRKTYPFSA